MNFKRGISPKESLNLGGLSFETMQPGAILKAKKWFGISKSTGILRGYTGAGIKFAKNDYILILNISPGTNNKKRNLSFVKTCRWDWIVSLKEEFERTGKVNVYSSTHGFFADMTKTKFNYRMEVISK